jgi:hypothetical protein
MTELAGLSTTGSLNTARRNLAGAGTQSSAVAFGGGGTAVQQQQKTGQVQEHH